VHNTGYVSSSKRFSFSFVQIASKISDNNQFNRCTIYSAHSFRQNAICDQHDCPCKHTNAVTLLQGRNDRKVKGERAVCQTTTCSCTEAFLITGAAKINCEDKLRRQTAKQILTKNKLHKFFLILYRQVIFEEKTKVKYRGFQ
jgi:hypothetical protein